jgi:hypothetical protein
MTCRCLNQDMGAGDSLTLRVPGVLQQAGTVCATARSFVLPKLGWRRQAHQILGFPCPLTGGEAAALPQPPRARLSSVGDAASPSDQVSEYARRWARPGLLRRPPSWGSPAEVQRYGPLGSDRPAAASLVRRLLRHEEKQRSRSPTPVKAVCDRVRETPPVRLPVGSLPEVGWWETGSEIGSVPSRTDQPPSGEATGTAVVRTGRTGHRAPARDYSLCFFFPKSDAQDHASWHFATGTTSCPRHPRVPPVAGQVV